MTKAYYVKRESDGTYTLRQTRYRERLAAGREHPHDVCASGFSLASIQELIRQHFKGEVEPF